MLSRPKQSSGGGSMNIMMYCNSTSTDNELYANNEDKQKFTPNNRTGLYGYIINQGYASTFQINNYIPRNSKS